MQAIQKDALEVIARLNERVNLEQVNEGNGTVVKIHKGYGDMHLFSIEKFVSDIESGRRGGFHVYMTRYAKVTKVDELYFGKHYYSMLNGWLERYSDLFRYSERVEVFYFVCKEIGLIGEDPFSFGNPDELVCADGVRYMDVFDELIERIRVYCQSREFKERERQRVFNAKRNVRNLLARENAMFSAETGRSRWLILSLTLGYKNRYRRWITPEMIQQHRNRFFAARRFNKLMSGVENFVWAIEQGEDAGLHLHVILFYSPDHNHDVFIARQIGEYWAHVVTEGRGSYWNSNKTELKPGYATRGHGIGVGQINWDDEKRREALRINLLYLAKAQQYLMIRCSDRIRTIGMGNKPKKKKSGRPRVDSEM
jgi:hypothetical protein